MSGIPHKHHGGAFQYLGEAGFDGEQPILANTSVMVSAALLAACLMFSACTVVKIGKGDTNSIEHDGGAEEANNLANRACRRADQQTAEIISTVNKDPSLPPGTGKQVTTFRCTSGAGR